MSYLPALIIGANGYVGSKLLESFKEKCHKTIATSYKPSPGLDYCDLKNPSLDFLANYSYRPKTAIIASACAKINICETNPHETYLVNVLGTLNLARMLKDLGIKPVIFSSDAIFNGEKEIYEDLSKPTPINEYGLQKTLLEQQIPRVCDDYLIIRLSKTYSSKNLDKTMLFDLKKQLLEKKVVKAASDLMFNPICIDDVVEAITLLLEKKATGLYNLSGLESYSWYDLTLLMAQHLGINPAKVEKCSIDSFSTGDTKRAKSLKMIPKRFIKEFPDFQFTSIEKSISVIKSNTQVSI